MTYLKLSESLTPEEPPTLLDPSREQGWVVEELLGELCAAGQ